MYFIVKFLIMKVIPFYFLAHSAGAVEYPDWNSAEG